MDSENILTIPEYVITRLNAISTKDRVINPNMAVLFNLEVNPSAYVMSTMREERSSNFNELFSANVSI